jgi:ribosomal protein S18 acetylase RimI-like enzyme
LFIVKGVIGNPKDNTSDMPEQFTLKNIIFRIANTNLEFDDGRYLFQQYAHSLNIELFYPDFSHELIMINKQYYLPKGALILAYENKVPVGCAAIREFDKDIAELKRLFIQPQYRGYKIGVKLLELVIDIVQELNYKQIRLDTVPTMTQEQNLYRVFGFYEIQPYRVDPIEGTIFMEMKLR